MSEASLLFAGDIKLDRPCAKKVTSRFRLNAQTSLFAANLEGPITTRGKPAEKISVIRMKPFAVNELKRLGVGLVSLANNHIMDYGPEGLNDTIAALSRAGIHYLGAGSSFEIATQAKILQLNGARVAFVAFCCTLAPGSAATGERPGVSPVRVETSYNLEPTWMAEEPGLPLFPTTELKTESERLVSRTIRKAKARADLCVSLFHWGLGLSPYNEYLAHYQRELAQLAVEGGCDLVVGGHPHRLQPIELKNKSAIVYSLGNFIFHGKKFGTMMSCYGGLLRARLRRRRISTLELKPIRLDEFGDPHPIEGRQAVSVLRALGNAGLLRKGSFEEKKGKILLYP